MWAKERLISLHPRNTNNFDSINAQFDSSDRKLRAIQRIKISFWKNKLKNSYTAQVTLNFGQDSTFAGQETAGGNADGNGKGNFHSAVPSGYLALSWCAGPRHPGLSLPSHTLLGPPAVPYLPDSIAFASPQSRPAALSASAWRLWPAVDGFAFSGPWSCRSILLCNQGRPPNWQEVTSVSLNLSHHMHGRGSPRQEPMVI